MKKLLVLLSVLVVAFGYSAAAHAQTEFEVGLKGWYSAPVEDFGDDFDGGFLYGIYGEVFFSPRFSMEMSLVRHTHDEGDDGLNALFPIHIRMSMFPGIPEENFDKPAEVTINELTLNARYYLTAGRFRPFLTAGGGIYFWDFYQQNLGDNTETDFGINGGGGFVFSLTERVNLGLELRYNYLWLQLAADDTDMQFVNLMALASYGF